MKGRGRISTHPTPASFKRHDQMGTCLARRMIDSTASKERSFTGERPSQLHEMCSRGSGEHRLRRTMVLESFFTREETNLTQECQDTTPTSSMQALTHCTRNANNRCRKDDFRLSCNPTTLASPPKDAHMHTPFHPPSDSFLHGISYLRQSF